MLRIVLAVLLLKQRSDHRRIGPADVENVTVMGADRADHVQLFGQLGGDVMKLARDRNVIAAMVVRVGGAVVVVHHVVGRVGDARGHAVVAVQDIVLEDQRQVKADGDKRQTELAEIACAQRGDGKQDITLEHCFSLLPGCTGARGEWTTGEEC